MRLSREVHGRARELIAQRLGLHFPEQRDDELGQRLLRASGASDVSGLERYVSLLRTLPEDSAEWRRFASHLTVNETYFLRDRDFMDALEREILPELIERRRSEGVPRLRLWSAGCSTGEEPYSLAILIDRLLPDPARWSVTILGTDIDPEALDAAERGLYREWSLRATPEWIRRRYFEPRPGGTYELSSRIRKLVTFAPLNLSEGTYPSLATNTTAMDLILCRNVVMYFTPETQRAAVTRFHDALVEGGWLAVSPAEASAQLLAPLEQVSVGSTICFRKAPASRPQALPDQRAAPTVHPGSPPAAPARAPRRSPTVASDAGDGLPPLERAALEAGKGNLDRARDLCLEAVAGNRLDPEAYLLLAAIQQERGDLPAAVQAIRRAIYLAPDSASAHFILGSLLHRQGEEIRARRSMETVVRLLEGVPADAEVAGADGLTAGRLVETAGAYLEPR